MEALPLNTDITPLLKDKYKFGLAILPFGSMFASIGLMLVPAFMEPGDWMLVVLMLAGYIFGWLLNAFVAKYFYSMSNKSIWMIYIQGMIPKDWFTDGGWQGYCQNCKLHVEIWKQKRTKGKTFFVTKASVSFYLLYLLLTLVYPYFFADSSIDWLHLVWLGFLWFIGFIGLSLIIWHSSESSCKRGQHFLDSQENMEVSVKEAKDVEVKMGILTYISSMLSCSVFIGIGLIVLWPNWTASDNYDLPTYDALSELTGKAKVYHVYENGLQFQLEGNTIIYKVTHYDKPSKFLEAKINDQVITIRADHNDSHSPMFSDESYHYVFELSMDGQLLMEYDKIYANFIEVKQQQPYIAIPFILLGLGFCWLTHRQFKRTNR